MIVLFSSLHRRKWHIRYGMAVGSKRDWRQTSSFIFCLQTAATRVEIWSYCFEYCVESDLAAMLSLQAAATSFISALLFRGNKYLQKYLEYKHQIAGKRGLGQPQGAC